MTLYTSLIQALVVIVGLILLSLFLKKKSIISEGDRPLFGRLVTDFALPALIFTGLFRSSPEAEELLAVFLMAISLLICMLLGWGAGKLIGLPPRELGAFILVAAFGSSSTLGYALISQAFPHDPTALAEAVVISELGVGIPIFTIGVGVAIYFGRQAEASLSSGLRQFLRSPIFISLVLGLAFSILRPTTGLLDIPLRILDLIGGSLVIFVALTIGLMLRPIPLRRLGILVVAVAVIKLVVKPMIALTLSEVELLPSLETELLLIETAMPSGTVAAVLADRYGCDGALASALVIATYVISLVTIPLVMMLAP